MRDTERLLLEAIKAGLDGLSEKHLGSCSATATEPNGICYIFDDEEYLISVKKRNSGLEDSSPLSPEPQTLEERVTDLIRKIGIPAHLKGYRYIREAILMILEDPSSLTDGITKRLYPDLANKYHTTPSRVERAIRHAIMSSWDKGNHVVQMFVLSYSVKDVARNPTNMEFISSMTECIRLGRDRSNLGGLWYE